MKNFNRRSSRGNHGSKRRELVQHTHSRGSHAFTHTLTSTQLQPRGAKRQLSYYFSVHSGSFPVSVIHRTLTRTTGSLSYVCDHSCACVYIRGSGTSTASQHNIFDSEKPTNFYYAPDGIRTYVLLESDALPIEPPRHPRDKGGGGGGGGGWQSCRNSSLVWHEVLRVRVPTLSI